MTKTRQNEQNKVKKTHHILQDKNGQNETKTTKTKSQKHKIAHITVQYSDSYKSIHSTVSKKHTKTKTILTFYANVCDNSLVEADIFTI